MAKLRGFLPRIEQHLYEISTVLVKLKIEKSSAAAMVEMTQDNYVASQPKSTARELSWEERASMQRTAALNQRIVQRSIEQEIEIVQLYYDTVDRHYKTLLSARQDIQTMTRLLQIGSILGEVV
jgi:hypothetical protein